MSDEIDNHVELVEGEESLGPQCGERLAEARRALQMTVLEIAKELHLDEHKVRALECNDFDVIGAPVFAKGHLRKYAQLVKANEADVMADYYELTRTSGAPPALAPRSRPREAISLGPWIAAIVVILVVASAYWWYASHAVTPETRITGEITPLPQEAQVAVEEEGATADTDDSVLEETIPISEPVAVPVPAVSADSNEMQLSITYLGDCWTEITDANGRRLFFDLGVTGRTVNLSGEAPFNVLFGDAANVSLELNGAAFQIPAADRRGPTARLTISGS